MKIIQICLVALALSSMLAGCGNKDKSNADIEPVVVPELSAEENAMAIAKAELQLQQEQEEKELKDFVQLLEGETWLCESTAEGETKVTSIWKRNFSDGIISQYVTLDLSEFSEAKDPIKLVDSTYDIIDSHSILIDDVITEVTVAGEKLIFTPGIGDSPYDVWQPESTYDN